MLNLSTLKKQAEAKLNNTTTEGVIDFNDIFKTSGTFTLTEVGYHNFKITATKAENNTLTLTGQITDDNGKIKDGNFYTITLRYFGDGNIFRQQYRDILEQLELPQNSDFSVLPQFENKTIVVKCIKNARGYAQYYVNINFIINSLAEEMNATE